MDAPEIGLGVVEGDRLLVERYFAAMQAGVAALDELVALFTDDAVLVDPFSGRTQTFEGRAAIRENYAQSFRNRPPGLTLTLDRLDAEAGSLRSHWTCKAPAFPSPLKGSDFYTIRGGRFTRLEARIRS